ncbi:MAG TPA: DegT/DnrJ/EryC1/StrS family aminotransferase [Methylococcaceae bacterium]|nr:DegT/DnrJ/EryC1/StrS family aminotransferase [Methylococcaceae bacterium]
MTTASEDTAARNGAWPYFAADEIEAARQVLASGKVNYWTGKECRGFEEEYAAFLGVRHAIALSNGTVALELALRALGVGAGDEVVVPAKTFIASASAVVMCGATPIICDVALESQNMTAETVLAVLSPRTRAIIPVHLGGWPCDMEPLLALAAQHGLFVIEDCAQAHGGRYRGRPVGSFGHCAAFSFCQDKIMTTGGEGGLLVTSDAAVWDRAWSFKDHGKSYAAVHSGVPSEGFAWVHESFGSNMRMTEMQAAIGRLQLQKLPIWVERRRHHAELLDEGLAGAPGVQVAKPGPDFHHAYYKYYFHLQPDALKPGWDKARILKAVHAEGVPCFSGSCSEIYREKAFRSAGLGPRQPLPNASRLEETSLMLLVHPTLGEADLAKAAQAARKVMFEAAR